ncbi:hypothetical protein [Maribellus maritimus]|uniref:hypothetical protein n=1 Tax=Maribellus maritimus TaxID=2870838 RepID=UPI001EE9B561|nr:hypothetical protein [Maribellus maritimus]MCG6187892.1 hypothetical protein [Maribellus maritimus]
MNGLKKRKTTLSFVINSKNYLGSDKNTLKSRIQAMDKGWIQKKNDIRKMKRTAENFKAGV